MSSVCLLAEKTKKSVSIRSPAKVNLFLEVTGKRADGYHNIVTIIHAIDLYDEITIEFAKSTRIINKTGKDPLELIGKAIREIELYTNQKINVLVKVDKNIPIGSGMGSGASNVAAMIQGIDELYSLKLTSTDKKRLATAIGSDVAFFLQSRLAICKGKGDLVEDLDIRTNLEYVILAPERRLLTKDVYNALTREQLIDKKSPTAIQNALKKGDAGSVMDSAFNRLLLPAAGLWPEIDTIMKVADMSGLNGLQMTGSGSAFYYVYKGDSIDSKAKEFQNNLRKARIKFSIFRCKGLN